MAALDIHPLGPDFFHLLDIQVFKRAVEVARLLAATVLYLPRHNQIVSEVRFGRHVD